MPRLLPPPAVLTELANKHYCLWPRLLCKQTFLLMSKSLKQCNLLMEHLAGCQHYSTVIITRKLDYEAQNMNMNMKLTFYVQSNPLTTFFFCFIRASKVFSLPFLSSHCHPLCPAPLLQNGRGDIRILSSFIVRAF